MIIFNPELFLGRPYTRENQQVQLPYMQLA